MQERKRWYRHNRDAQTRVIEALAYRLPMAVSEYKQFSDRDIYWVCPRCRRTLDRDFQDYCDRCGQRLNWDALEP